MTSPASILLAEDEPYLRTVYSTYFEAAGFEVRAAANGREALELIRSAIPDLLLLDLWMPELNGFEVLDRLRHDPAAGRIKIVVLSAAIDAESRLEAFGSGALEYLDKGSSLEDLLACVRRIVAGAVAPEPA